MSKKTRKKSSKKPTRTPSPSAAKKLAGTKNAGSGAKTSAKKTPVKKTAVKKAPLKTPPAKAGKAAATKSGKSSQTASAKESHKPASKQLKSAPAAIAKPGPASPLVEGAQAPGFHLPRDGGENVSLADFDGQKLVLFFYPRADTPGCTREAIDFTRLKNAFADAGTAILGISADTVKAQESFRNKHQLAIPLISDEHHQMLETYGAWGEKSMYGRSFMGIIRTTVLIGIDGHIARIWRNVRVDGHADEVLAAARAL